MFVRHLRLVPIALFALSLASAGCRKAPAPADDNALASQVQSRLNADQALAGQPIQVTVQSGNVTLNGAVADSAQRELASRDLTGIDGIKQVLNNLTIQQSPTTAPPESVASTTPPPPPPPIPSRAIAPQPKPAPYSPAPIERSPAAFAPPPVEHQQPQLPPPPPQAIFRTITLPAGTAIPIRITQTLDSATTQPDDSFTGAIASDLVVDGLVVVPQGTPVTGHVDAAQDAAHFKGSSLLSISLTSINRRGDRISLTTEPYSVKGKGRGESTAIKAGIGAGAGALLGGLLGGGKGAAIGAVAGGGVGAGSSAVTRGQQVQIPSESLVRFQLTAPVNVRVQTSGPHDDHRDSDSGLQTRPRN